MPADRTALRRAILAVIPANVPLRGRYATAIMRDAVGLELDRLEARIRAMEETPRRVGAALDAAIRMDAILLMLERVRASEEPDANLDRHLCRALNVAPWAEAPIEWLQHCRPKSKIAIETPAAMASIDDALALILAVLPDSGWSILQEPHVPPHQPRATVFQGPLFSSGDAATPALALCAALLQALITRAEADHG